MNNQQVKQQAKRQKVLIINLYNKPTYTKELEDNLCFWRVPYEIYGYASFGAIDFGRFSHIMLTGSDFFVPATRVLSREQVARVLAAGKPVLAQCYGFHLLAYYYGAPAYVRTFVKNKHKEYMRIPSPLVSEEGGVYFVNHWNYVAADLLGRDPAWDVISQAAIVEDGQEKRYVVDAMMRNYPVLCLQYHPESSETNYNFLYKWLNSTFSHLI